jgi:hypothetical protein
MPTDHSSTDNSSTGLRLTRRRALAVGGATLAAVGLGAPAVLGQGREQTVTFTARITNVSDGMTLMTTAEDDAAEQAVPLSPGVWALHTRDEPLFTEGEMERDNGLEEIAEDGMPGKLAAMLADRDTVVASGAFTTPVGADGPAPLTPGDSYEFSFEATSGKPTLYLSLVTMFVPSNDLFYSLGGAAGVPVFGHPGMGEENGNGENGNAMRPLTGDVTEYVGLWDAGTEVNQEPGVGDNQVQRQRGAGVGDVERGTVARIEDVNGYDYPATSDVIRVELMAE